MGTSQNKKALLARKTARWLGLPAAIVATVYLAVGYFYPTEVYEAKLLLELKLAGVREFRAQGLHGFEKNHCHESNPRCACIGMIHGLGDTALTWKRLLLHPKWSTPVRLVAFDLPGSGKTPRSTVENYRIRKQAQTLQKAYQSLCPRWILLGNSMGSWIATWIALDWPEGIEKLILTSPTGLKAVRNQNAARLLTQPTVESLKEFQKRAYARPRPLPESVWKAVVEKMKNGPTPEIRAAQTPEDDLDGRLGSIRQATMVLQGASDRIGSVVGAKEFSAQLPQGIYRQIEDCGHLPQKECPQVVIKSVQEMIQQGIM